jgi:DNA-binding SARP family transcriptional activator
MRRQCSVRVLGGFRADVGERAVPAEAWQHRRGADLVKLLAITPEHRLHREQVIDALWPDLPPEAGFANLRKALHYARRALGSEEAATVRGGVVHLWPDGRLSVDADGFEAAAGEALRRGDPGSAREAASRYPGELLPDDRYEPWTHGPRDRLGRRYLQVLKLAGDWDRVVELDPVDEQAHRELMRGHFERGDRQAAMRQFETLRRALHEELGVGPDPTTVSLYEEILAMEGEEPATPSERAVAHLSAGLVAFNRMDLDEAEREARLARQIAFEAGLERELGEASGLLGMVAHGRGRWRELFGQEFLDTVRASPNFAGPVFEAHLCLAEFSLYSTEDPAEVEAFAGELLELAERHGSAHGRAVATLMLGESHLMSGHLERAEEELSMAAQLHGKLGAVAGRALSLERLAEAALLARRRARAKRLLADAHGLAVGSSLESHLLVRILGSKIRAAADSDASLEAVRAAEGELAGRQVCEPCSMDFRIAAAVASARASRLDDARRFLEQAERVAGMWGRGPWLASVWEARGEVRLAEDEPVQAAALLREAADLFARAGHILSASRCSSAASAAANLSRSQL